ncbi:MAG TPA: T9SS type A sorting domain-containing protein, partial [Chitinophagaceae bacterium]|nr:T9SS type A sorting domain-containing protein [Chitinophagaceae bacterium]
DIQSPVFSETETASTVDVFNNEINNGSIEFDCETASVTYKDVISSTNNCPVIVTRTWTVTGTNGSSATANQTITIKDETAPTLKSNVTLPTGGVNINACAASTGPTADEIKALYQDNCNGIITVTKSGTPAGNTCAWSVTYTYEIKDACGNTVSPSPTVTYSGGDKTPPTGSMEPVNAYLWPPNHKMRDINFRQINFNDNCGGTVNYRITDVSSNELVNEGGDGDTAPDWIISTDGKSLQLRAERSGTGTGRIYTISYTLSDPCGNTTSGTTYAYVSHDIKKPVIGASYKTGSTIALAGEFGDKPGNRHTAKWIIDGVSISGTVTAEPSAGKPGTVTGSWKPNAAGVYAVQLNITDQNGNTSFVNTNGDMQAVIVVYDPNGGYTFGQGTFKAPAGSVPSNATATPVVTYGFQSNYFKKATNPKGETQLDFDAGEFRFNALNFDYLAVNGKNAQFKGTGKITNAAGETIQSGVYFVLTVQDNGDNTTTSVDKIRMKIYNKNTGQVYFDNQMGAGDAVFPVQTVTKGSTIGIVSGNMTVGSGSGNISSRSATNNVSPEEDSTVQQNELHLYPNPARDQFTVQIKLPGNLNDIATIQLLDLNGKLLMTQTVSVLNGVVQKQVMVSSTLSSGVYIVRIIADGKKYHQKLLLEK